MVGKVCILLMDSLGIGASLDAEDYGDNGANTFGHVYQTCQTLGRNLAIPQLSHLGLYHATVASSGLEGIDLAKLPHPLGYFGYAVEQSLGKDTPSGHWELMGVPVNYKWGYFPQEIPCFPAELTASLIEKAGLPGILGEKHASGTDIIQELGEEHIRTGKPIIYTSADSVFQIAAHEESFGLQKLYKLCEIARELVDPYKIGRVIARPFSGEVGQFTRTKNRKDYTSPPPALTLLDKLLENGQEVIGIGKIKDIFAGQGITQSINPGGNQTIFEETIKQFAEAPSRSLVFANFVDFDSVYGHRRNILGYAQALEEFDAYLPSLMNIMQDEDLLVITADHGCDPTFPGSDHTREHIPILIYGRHLKPKFIGRRDTFADLGQSLADYFQLPPLLYGVSFF